MSVFTLYPRKQLGFTIRADAPVRNATYVRIAGLNILAGDIADAIYLHVRLNDLPQTRHGGGSGTSKSGDPPLTDESKLSTEQWLATRTIESVGQETTVLDGAIAVKLLKADFGFTIGTLAVDNDTKEVNYGPALILTFLFSNTSTHTIDVDGGAFSKSVCLVFGKDNLGNELHQTIPDIWWQFATIRSSDRNHLVSLPSKADWTIRIPVTPATDSADSYALVCEFPGGRDLGKNRNSGLFGVRLQRSECVVDPSTSSIRFVTAPELHKLVGQNELVAKKRFEDQDTFVSGVVQSVAIDNGSIIVELATGDVTPPVRCMLRPDQEKSVERLEAGHHCTIRGAYSGRHTIFVAIMDGIIIHPKS